MLKVKNRNIRMAPKKSNYKKTLISLLINFITIAVTIIGGISNIVATLLGFIGFCITQVKYAHENHHVRKQNTELKAVFNRNKQLLEAKDYSITLETPKGYIDNLGLHENISSKLSSSALVICNLALAAGAMATAISAKVEIDNQQLADGKFCQKTLCWISYGLGATAIALSTAEQHYKSMNLSRRKSTLKNGNMVLNPILRSEGIMPQATRRKTRQCSIM